MLRSRAAIAVTVALTAAVLVVGCGSKDDSASGSGKSGSSTTTAKEQLTAKMTILKIAGLDGQFAEFLDFADTAGIKNELQSEGPFTVFAPDTASIVKLGGGQVKALKANKAALKVILENHLVKGELTLADLIDRNGKTLDAVSGKKLLVKVNGNTVTVGGVKILKSDIEASNGMVYVVDGLVKPQS